MLTALILWTMTTLLGTVLIGLPVLHKLTSGR